MITGTDEYIISLYDSLVHYVCIGWICTQFLKIVEFRKVCNIVGLEIEM